MRGTPDITDSHIPRTVVELPHLANIHPAPVFADLDLVMGTDLDPPAALLKGVDLSGADNPLANPFALIRPHGDAHLILPVIDDFKEAAGFVSVAFRRSGRRLVGKLRPTGRKRELYLNLRHGQERGAKQDNSQYAIPSDPLERHIHSFQSSGDHCGAPFHNASIDRRHKEEIARFVPDIVEVSVFRGLYAPVRLCHEGDPGCNLVIQLLSFQDIAIHAEHV